MRALFLVIVTFACALMGWLVYTQPTSAGNDRAPTVVGASQSGQPDFNKFSAVAEQKREQATLAQCDQKAANRQLGHDDKISFILQCVRAADSARQDSQP